MSSRATRQDVALAAGVSGATVSRVYNHPDLVDAATLERVRTAAAALGFVPDKHAAALRRRSSGTLLFVEIEEEGYRWPGQKAYMSLYGEIVRAVLHAVQATPFTLQLVSLAPSDLATLNNLDFAGILGFDVTEQRWADALAALGRPVVCCHHGDHLTGVSTVTTDNRAGGALQARHLRSLGDQSVAYVTGMRDEVRSHRLRWEGFSGELRPQLVLDALGYAAGRNAAAALAEAIRQGRVTAAACVNDLTAMGLIDGLAAQGLAGHCVVGYDNLVVGGLLGHALPTVEARLPDVYTRALALLTDQTALDDEVHETVSPVLVDPNDALSPSTEKSGP